MRGRTAKQSTTSRSSSANGSIVNDDVGSVQCADGTRTASSQGYVRYVRQHIRAFDGQTLKLKLANFPLHFGEKGEEMQRVQS